ncbi:MAG: MogA/MoaB family molybdenum cofactor biosynthesis protein [Proteobacteria bacterium]|nr:MogA/MoaB family molybdenum cofactor biosynthesis protein [Pseudomonadota bacterium]
MYRVAIITLSDTASKGVRLDLSGEEIKKMITHLGDIVYYEILPDDIELIEDRLKKLCDSNIADLVLTTGGTGFTERDITPEATKRVIEREVPGISEYMRIKSAEISKNAILSRGISGIRKKTLIINLPGSVKAVKENLSLILSVLPHALEKLKGDTRPCGD